MNNPKKTHTSDKLELSNLFIGEDGLLSLWHGGLEVEVEVVGAKPSPNFVGWCCKHK